MYYSGEFGLLYKQQPIDVYRLNFHRNEYFRGCASLQPRLAELKQLTSEIIYVKVYIA